MVVNDEKVEIPDCLDVLEMVVQNDEHIHETVEKVVIDEIDGLVVIDIRYEVEHQIKHEFDENEFFVVGMVDEQVEVGHDEMVVTQSQMFIDSIWTQGIFGINASTQDDETVEKVVIQIIDNHETVETVQTVDK